MVVDTSAVLSILLAEHDAPRFAFAISRDLKRMISTATFVEISIVLEGRGGRVSLAHLDQFLALSRFEIVAFDAEQARVARTAFQLYGKGRHRAGLNFGDCFSYALAKISGEPLLYKGGDFAQTDVRAAL